MASGKEGGIKRSGKVRPLHQRAIGKKMGLAASQNKKRAQRKIRNRIGHSPMSVREGAANLTLSSDYANEKKKD